MNENPGGSNRRLLLFVGAVGVVLVGIVAFVTLSMAGSGGDGRLLSPMAAGTAPAKGGAKVRHQEPVARVVAQVTAAPSARPSPSASASPSPKPTRSPAPKPSPKGSPAPKPSAAKNLVRAAPVPARAVQVASLPRGENAGSQPLGRAPLPALPSAEPAPTFVPTQPPPPTAAAPKLEDAKILRAAVPELDDNARNSTSLPATVTVIVTVGPNGRAESVRIERSSGSMYVDREAASAARLTTYVPAKIDGRATVGTYRAIYEFR